MTSRLGSMYEITSKATKRSGVFLRRNMTFAPKETKIQKRYWAGPLEYAARVWNPYQQTDIYRAEKVRSVYWYKVQKSTIGRVDAGIGNQSHVTTRIQVFLSGDLENFFVTNVFHRGPHRSSSRSNISNCFSRGSVPVFLRERIAACDSPWVGF